MINNYRHCDVEEKDSLYAQDSENDSNVSKKKMENLIVYTFLSIISNVILRASIP